jgi:NTE family protein
MKRINLVILVLMVALNIFCQEKIGLALSGGGARGLAHIGVLKVIDELEIPVDCIAGTSTGAIIGGLYAMGYSGTEIENIVLGIAWEDMFDEKICREDVYIGEKRWGPFANSYFALDDKFIPKLPQAFLSGNNLVNKLFEIFYPVSYINDFDELPIPFRCVATNILTGEITVFEEGSLHEAIRASLSFPSIIKPFELHNQLYVDGGIVRNLPVEAVRSMGADIIIGIKTNSGLRSKEELKSLIDVLDQTINLQITRNIGESIDKCEFLIEPDLENISLLDFSQKQKIIALGELAARDFFQSSEYKFPARTTKKNTEFLPEKIKFSSITVLGNKYLSKAKVREYVGLERSSLYSSKDICTAVREAYNSNLFTYIYPVIEETENDYKLTVKVEERDRKKLGFNLSYNNENELVAGVTLELNNMLQKNSKLLLNVQAGSRNEADLDYVKNFGKHWGVYFRLFPYIKESRLYSYNEDHKKTNSVRSLEYGSTLGVGIYITKAIIAEGYGYGYRSKVYQDIAEFDESEFHSTGIGLKLYHESLDDFVFPMSGTQFIAKYSTSRKGAYSEEGNKKFYSRLRFFLPFGKDFSMKYQFEYGSHFENYTDNFDPFYIGGIDSYMGLKSKEKSAPIYKINTLAFRLQIVRNLFIDLQFNTLNLGNIDYWQPEKYLYKATGVKIGYKTLVGPIRAGMALDEDGRSNYYLSIGYEFDSFEFSRR